MKNDMYCEWNQDETRCESPYAVATGDGGDSINDGDSDRGDMGSDIRSDQQCQELSRKGCMKNDMYCEWNQDETRCESPYAVVTDDGGDSINDGDSDRGDIRSDQQCQELSRKGCMKNDMYCEWNQDETRCESPYAVATGDGGDGINDGDSDMGSDIRSGQQCQELSRRECPTISGCTWGGREIQCISNASTINSDSPDS